MACRLFVKNGFLLLLMAVSFAGTGAPPYGNEWINYNQQYFAVKVNEDGLYRINYNTLLNAGVPLGTFDPRNFQVFARGEEQPIIVKNEHTGNFQPGDYIKFYAEKNDGWLDRWFYDNPENQPNPGFSLVNDTATYYITWNNLLNNKRFVRETDDDFDGYSPAPYFWYTSRQDYTSNYFAGETNNYGVTDPEFTQAQGWFDSAFNVGQSRTKTIPNPNRYTGENLDAQIEFALAGASNYRPLDPNHHLRIQFAGQIIDTLFTGYKLLRFNETVPVSSLASEGTPFVFSSIDDLGTPADRNTIAYIEVKYPHTFNLRNQSAMSMLLPASGGNKTLVSFTNFNAATQDSVWVFDLHNHRQIPASRSGDTFKALVPFATQDRHCLLISSAEIKTVAQVRPVSNNPAHFAQFRDFSAPEFSNRDFLMITHQSLMPEAESYKNYRNTTGYEVLLADVQELYHQFAYGIHKHPLALRNFARFALDHFNQPPRKLFLVGKALNTRHFRKNNTHYANTLVPSFGDPASDILITAGLDNELYAPAIATGRLAAKNPAHVSLYLGKVMQYETAQQQPQEWMKNILHFGGGSSVAEQNILKGYLKQYEQKVSDTLFGGYVRTFLKSSTDPIQINQSDSLRDIINNGVSIMTFFGHAAGIGFDISIDYPSEYNNYGKYPFLVANSCFAGDVFGPSVSSSEEFVLIENKGTIGYLAATSAAGAYELNLYSNRFFHNLSGPFYGKPVGKNIRNTIEEVQTTNIYVKNIILLKTLHGDPAIVINSQPRPDYKITPQDIYFTPKNVTTEVDSFTVNVISTNIGKAIADSMMVEVTRTFPEGATETYLRRIRGTYFKDTLSFRMPVDREKGIGMNQISVTLDAYSEVEEMDETNNMTITSLFISSADVIPVFPHRYAIVPDAQVMLKASTGNPFLEERNYVFEVDTSASFKNPIRQNISQKGGVLSWQPPLMMTDSTVYYWRVSMDSTYTGEYNWRTSSFQYISGKEGWSQAHFDQFANNKYRYVTYNAAERQWDFVNNVLSIQAQTGVYPYIPWQEVWLRVNAVTKRTWSCLADVGHGIIVFVFDPISGELWQSFNQGNNTGQYGNYHCFANPMNGFDFYTSNQQWRNRLHNFLDTIPEGHHVLAWNHRNTYVESFHEELYEAFEAIGSANIRSLENNRPYLIFGKKGEPMGSANEVIGGSISSIIQLTDSLETNWNEGYIFSERIGPARQWESLHWRQESFDGLNTDSVWLHVIGETPAGILDTLLKNIPAETTDIYNLSDEIDAATYPYLRMMVNMRDDENRTPAQMRRWQVIYEGVPEAAIDPSTHFVFHADTLAQGESLRFSTAIRNISSYDLDSLKVNYWVMDQNRNIHPIEYARQAPLKAGEVLIDTVNFNTRETPGVNAFWMEVNPENDQAEQYHVNNIGQLPFLVRKDETNPLLDVTFDGVRIMDGDIVSAEPMIQVKLTDENPFLELNDTSLVKVYLQTPSRSDPQRIYFYEDGVENMRFYPASMPNNSCTVEFNPTFTEDGTYRLLVQATDKTMNESGQEDYNIRFEVITRSTITEVLNWPNPFSTATHFVFTLTGSELPTFFKIQIMTVTGKVVKEIDMDELGPIRMGRNITDYAWDGTDRYGDRLANGVYLYRVITNINGEEIELNPTAASKYFHKEFGKMYLIR